ncbi:MAG: UDP-N-acetylmuramoyl-L-alanyl-D-glutamate--2,6-diaminopimelate ligase [Saccharofermentans sp.]|nr:UDP-N-acetylmuramoyl-L-alanyl-D-glutamate--2,6-diaminopimelate ligase [Saccharofermentans sp.]
MSMILSTLMQGVTHRLIAGNMGRRVSSVEYDSRKIQENSAFVAIKGFTSDGHDYVAKAIESGAGTIVVNKERDSLSDDELIALSEAKGVTVLEMEDTRKGIAVLSAQFYNHPEDRLDLVGVTGTKGKTTITFMIHEILKRANHSTGLIGTVCNMIGDEKRKASHTTPESHEVYELLEEMAKKQFDSCVMEVSSQGLKLDRVHGLRFDVGCFTNLYEDHIGGNEHPDMEDYFSCKLKIFDSSRTAVVNRDCDVAKEVIDYASKCCPVYTYGLSPESDCYAKDIQKKRINGVTGTEFYVESPWYEGTVFMALPGEFNVYNALCAISTAGLLKIDFEVVKDALSNVHVPGRVQPVPNNLDVTILVDYAHNAASLESVVKTLKSYCEGKVITVFGCGGNRSTTRRYEMGEVSGKLSDYTVITSDNPRKEEPLEIINMIVEGMQRTDGKYEVIVDRAEAIEAAIKMAQPGDTVLIAGKGHEDYQIFADKTIHFDDSEVALEVVNRLESEK